MTGKRRDRVDERAAELQRESNDPDLKDAEVARDAAEQILEESDDRMEEAVHQDPEGDDQIRRKSEETAVEPE
jgi:hypothetical protein